MTASDQNPPVLPSSGETLVFPPFDAQQMQALNTVPNMSFDPQQTAELPPAENYIHNQIPPIPTAHGEASTGDAAEQVNIVQELQRATAAAAVDGAANVSKGELANILEGFARVLRADATFTSVSYADHVAEVAQLKELLLEAQETIINLLNDRVFDRAKLARLEAELRVMPDLQAQATRAMTLAANSEDVQKELASVKAEVERLRTSYVRAEQSSGTWLTRLFKAKP